MGFMNTFDTLKRTKVSLIINEIGKVIDSTNNELEEDCIVANDFSYQNYMFCSNKYYTINNDGHFTYI